MEVATISRFELSTPRILGAVVEAIARHKPEVTGRHLDVGCGDGELIQLIRKRFPVESAGCDYTDQIMKLAGQKVDVVDLNSGGLPYRDAEFDLITMTEVVEHLDHDRRIFRELFRILKPAGLLVVSTPNILNLKSRMRFLSFGFWNLFGPLPMGSQPYNTSGHINPISCFYLAHAVNGAGFREIFLDVDSFQKSSLVLFILLCFPIKFFGWLAYSKEVRKYRTIDVGNAEIVKAMNSTPVLLGRTIVLSAIKPGGSLAGQA